MMFILASWILGKRQPNIKTFILLMTILFGLVMVLDLRSAFNEQTVNKDALQGIVLASLSAVFLTITMWLTQYHLAPVAGSVRSSYTMLVVIIIMGIIGLSECWLARLGRFGGDVWHRFYPVICTGSSA